MGVSLGLRGGGGGAGFRAERVLLDCKRSWRPSSMSLLRLLFWSSSDSDWLVVRGAVLGVAWALALRIFCRASCPRFKSASRSKGVLVGLPPIAGLGREGVGGLGPAWPLGIFLAVSVVVLGAWPSFPRFNLSRAAFPLRLSSSRSIVGFTVGFGGGFGVALMPLLVTLSFAFGLTIGVETFRGACVGFGTVGLGGGAGVTFKVAFLGVVVSMPFPTVASILLVVGLALVTDSLVSDSGPLARGGGGGGLRRCGCSGSASFIFSSATRSGSFVSSSSTERFFPDDFAVFSTALA